MNKSPLYSAFFISPLLFLISFRPAQAAFRFATISDAHVETANFTQTMTQIKTNNPNFILFNGDVENDGVINSEMDPLITVFSDQLNKTFLVRGNHDDHVATSATLWQNYFVAKYGTNRPLTLPAGATNYVAINANSTYLTYSFDYDNSRFIGLDSNQYGDAPTTTQLTFLDQRLADAEASGLIHAFIFTHPPEYCVDSTHCSCQTVTGCGPSQQYINIINNHPIVSATFHGHEHLLAWVHMSSTRSPGLTHEYEEFITSPAGNPYGSTVYPARTDFYNRDTNGLAFGLIDIDGVNFTVKFYHVGNSTPLWTKTFSKNGVISPTPTPLPTPTVAPTPTPTPPPNSDINTRPTKYYVVDRVRTNTDFAKLAAWGINTAIVDFKTDGTTAEWDTVVSAAAAAHINLVIWPDAHQGSDVSGCRWETPFDDADTNNGTDYLLKIRTILNELGNKPNVIGIVTAHEPVWIENAVTEDRCGETIADMMAIKTQVHTYIDTTVHRNSNYPPFKVWNYIDNIYNIANISDYSSTNKKAQIQGILDVAVIWQHCAGYPTYKGDGSACEGTSQYTALGGITYDRNTMIKANDLEGIVEEVFLMQTFSQGTSGDYAGKYTLAELQKYSTDFLNSSALDGFGYYTWDEGWYTGNLKKWTDLQPAVAYVYNSAVNKSTNPPPLSYDLNGDGVVNILDFTVFRQFYTEKNTRIDFNGDGVVNILDYAFFKKGYSYS